MHGRTRIGITILLGVVALYGASKAWPLISGPVIEVSTLSSDKQTGVTALSGTAKNTQTLSLNGGPLLIDSQGRFSTLLTLPRGSGILTLSATDRFGRDTSEQHHTITP